MQLQCKTITNIYLMLDPNICKERIKQNRWFPQRRGMHLGYLFPWTSAAFHAGKTPVKHTNDRIDDFLKAYFLRKKERVQKFNTSMRMRHTLRIENCLVLCKYKDVVQTLAGLSSALSVIKSPDIFSSIIKYSL